MKVQGFSMGADITEFSTDGTLAGDSDNVVPTEKAVATAINNKSDNLLINQDFSIWQENTTFTNPTNTTYTADGYYIGKADGDGTAPSINVKKNTTNMETGFEQCCELEITNVGVQGTNVRWEYLQRIEDYKEYRGKSVVLSFRVKASTAITLSSGQLMVYDGVGYDTVAVTSITTSWVTYSCTISSVSTSSNRLEIRFRLIPTGSGTISNTGSIYVQWMKLELGSVATPLIPRNTGEDLALCQRYYQKSYALGTFAGATANIGREVFSLNNVNSADHTIYITVTLVVPMKSTPTVTLYDPAGNVGKVYMAAGGDIDGTVSFANERNFMAYGTNGAASTTRTLAFQYTAVSRVS